MEWRHNLRPYQKTRYKLLRKKELRISEEHQAREERERKRDRIERTSRVADAHFDKVVRSYKRGERERAAVAKAEQEAKDRRKRRTHTAGELAARA